MGKEKRWIWQDEAYPLFTYDPKKLDRLIEAVSRKQGELMVLGRVIGHESLEQSQRNALESEIIASAAIEGEILDRDSVKSSIKERLGIEVSDSYRAKTKESNYVDILLDANSSYAQPLILDKIFAWHTQMFEGHHSAMRQMEIGAFRGSDTMQIVSGVVGKEKVFYEAPPHHLLGKEMDAYIRWFNAAPSSLIKAAIAHLWFVIIHPFDDGNGRITRAITDRVLSALETSVPMRLYSMSKSINSDRKSYYRALEYTTGYIAKEDPMDITLWCEWFLETLSHALSEAIASVEHVVDKARFWDKHRGSALNERQTKVLNIILDRGIAHIESGLSTKKYMKMANTTSATASRDMKALVVLGCIEQLEGTSGRNIRYRVIL